MLRCYDQLYAQKYEVSLINEQNNNTIANAEARQRPSNEPRHIL